MSRKPSQKTLNDRLKKKVEKAYYASCRGIQIDIMDISKVFEHGKKLLSEGLPEDALPGAIRAFVDTIRKN